SAGPVGIELRSFVSQLVSGETANSDVLSDFGNLLRQEILDRHGRVFDEGLLQQATLLVELLELALNNLVPGRFGFAHLLALRTINGHFLLDYLGRDVFALDELRTRGGDLQR